MRANGRTLVLMRLWPARKPPPPPTVYVGDYTHKLSRIRALDHDEDAVSYTHLTLPTTPYV